MRLQARLIITLKIILNGILCSTLGFLLASCAHNSYSSQELQQGKSSFAEGNFKKSFYKLLPVAINGDPQAEYAVGYMYYYGYGITRDADAGIFWMNRSADQGYRPAIRALNLIHEHCMYGDTCPFYHREEKAIMPRALYKDEVAPTPTCSGGEQVPVESPTPVLPMNPDPPSYTERNVEKTKPLAEKTMLALSNKMQLSEQKYSLQLFGAYHFKDVKNLQQHLQAKNSTHIWHTQHNGKDWYVLTYGKYASASQAKVAKIQLSENMHSFGPWVRDVSEMENVG